MDRIKSLQQIFTRIIPGKKQDPQQRVIFEQKNDEFVKSKPDKKLLSNIKKEFLDYSIVESLQSLIDEGFAQKGKYSIGFIVANTEQQEILGATIGVKDWDSDEVTVTKISSKDFWNIISDIKNKQLKKHPEIEEEVDALCTQLLQKFAKTDDKK